MQLSSPRAERADLAACAERLRQGSKSFHAASRLLPPRLRPEVTALYAFCRVADDAVDEADEPARGVEAVRALLDRAYSGCPADDAVERAFTRLVEARRLPRALPEALVEGFVWDATGREYETLSDVLEYAARVAASVGALMTLLMGPRDASTLARACDLGRAMQLTNIARDVGTDARIGRIYLPGAWRREAGVPEGSLGLTPRHSTPLATVVARLLDEADRLYARAEAGVAGLPVDCRPAIRAAGLIYADIGRVVRRQACNPVDRRARTSLGRKLWLLWRARRELEPNPGVAALPPAPEVAFLIDAVLGAP